MTDEAGIKEIDKRWREREAGGGQVMWKCSIRLVECFIESGFCFDVSMVHRCAALRISLIFTCSENPQKVLNQIIHQGNI